MTINSVVLCVGFFSFAAGFFTCKMGLILLRKALVKYGIDHRVGSTLSRMIAEIAIIDRTKARFVKVNQIVEEQLDLMAQADHPSTNASHSKYKNSIVKRLKELEEEKINIFRTILKDGLDPNLIALIDGKKTPIKMSEVIAQHDRLAANNEPQDQTPGKNVPIKKEAKVLKLVVNNTEKDNRATNQSNNTEVP